MRKEISTNKQFYDYFLSGQKIGEEVYMGRDIAMIVYD